MIGVFDAPTTPSRTTALELVSPAGDALKCAVAFHYGADAVYLGGTDFNLRAQAAGAGAEDLARAVADAHSRAGKVYLALNAYVHERDIGRLREFISGIRLIPFDAFIVSELGVLAVLKKIIPHARVHVSTQACVTNASAAEAWRSLGASRVVLARELTLDDIRAVRNATDIELEVFVHGAMCIAYAGRCLISNYLVSRSANSGDCAHACRWKYRLVEEESRPGEMFPVVEGDGYSRIFSSKDISMARHLDVLVNAGVNAVKIEGRMKSVYYVANVTRVYRRLIDGLSGGRAYDAVLAAGDLPEYLGELEKVTHRPYGNGFFFGGPSAEGAYPTDTPYLPGRRLMAIATAVDGRRARLTVFNTITSGMSLTAIGRDYCSRSYGSYRLCVRDEKGVSDAQRVRAVDEAYFESDIPLAQYDILTLESE